MSSVIESGGKGVRGYWVRQQGLLGLVTRDQMARVVSQVTIWECLRTSCMLQRVSSHARRVLDSSPCFPWGNNFEFGLI